MINYSVIIPHKNSADLLTYCLSTIPVRDDVQVVVVDDNSDSTKVDFEHFPQWGGQKYEYYLTKEGKGAGYARNVGLEHAKGKWVLFVDADDYLLPTLNDIFNECVNSDADIIYFRPKAVMLKDRKSPSNRADAYNGIINRYFENRDETELRVRFFSPTCKFVKRELIEKNNIRFEEIKYSNDNLFAVMIGCNAKSIEVSNDTYYIITECNNSLRAGYCTKTGELEIRASAFFRVCQYIEKYNYAIDKILLYDFLSRMLVSERKLYKVYFRKSLQMLNCTRLQLIYSEFQSNRFFSRIKRSICAWIITL